MGNLNLFVISYVLLWVLVVCETVMLFVLLRTLGHLFLAERPVSDREGIPVGRQLPDVPTTTPDGGEKRTLLALLPQKPYTAVILVTPTCEYCHGAVEVVREATARLPWLGATVLVEGTRLDGYAQVTEWGTVSMITQETAQELYVRATPFVLIVDDTAHVVAKGVVNTKDHLADLLKPVTERTTELPIRSV